MKKITIITIFSLFMVFQIHAQERKAGVLESKEQSVGLATGIDYAILPLEVNYKRGFNLFEWKFPVSFGADITIPIFDFDLSDIRIRATSDFTLFQKGVFEIRGGIDPMLIKTKMQTENMISLGMDFHVFTGITSQKWNVGLEVNFNQIVSTYIKHSEKYTENVYSEVVDGWYKTTASNIRLGVLVGKRYSNFDVILKGGLSKTGQFNNYLFVPTIYTLIGLNYTF